MQLKLLITDCDKQPRLVGAFNAEDAEKIIATFAMWGQKVYANDTIIHDDTGFVHVNIPNDRRSHDFWFTFPADDGGDNHCNVKIQIGIGRREHFQDCFVALLLC